MGAAGSPKASYNGKIGCSSYSGVIVLNQRIIKFKMYLVHFRLNLLSLDFSNLVARIS
jgi:hypothetical protein